MTDKMFGNRHFSNPTPLIEEIRGTNTSYIAALANAEKGSMDDRIIKNSWRTKLESQMKELSLYVQITSKGDDVIVSSSGLDVNKKTVAVGALPKPENMIVKMGNNMGSVWVS